LRFKLCIGYHTVRHDHFECYNILSAIYGSPPSCRIDKPALITGIHKVINSFPRITAAHGYAPTSGEQQLLSCSYAKCGYRHAVLQLEPGGMFRPLNVSIINVTEINAEVIESWCSNCVHTRCLTILLFIEKIVMPNAFVLKN
jgi:hypothetical protein